MGYYIPGPPLDKTRHIIANHGGVEVDFAAARTAMTDPHKAVISIKYNGPFEAAGFCFSEEEFAAFSEPSDPRYTRWVLMPRELAMSLSEFPTALANR